MDFGIFNILNHLLTKKDSHQLVSTKELKSLPVHLNGNGENFFF